MTASDQPSACDLSLTEIVDRSGIAYPAPRPYTHITAALVAWNEAPRIEALLKHLRPWFDTLAVAVQRSTDGTEDIAARHADTLVFDDHRGYGDATFGPKLLPQVRTRWTLKVDCDEWPDEELLGSLAHVTWYLDDRGLDGAWIPFHSAVEGLEYTEQHAHLRLFATKVGWPATLHSRPMTSDAIYWPHGHIRHDRSLDEVARDYLRYWHIGRGNAGWEAHNRVMMFEACRGTADALGWEFVQSFPWWPEIESIAFTETKPWLAAERS